MPSSNARRPWSPQELLLAFRLYCYTPFGKLHQSNPAIVNLAQRLGRTPSSIAMKTVNFASLDPHHQRRGVSGLGNVSRADRELWNRFALEPDAVAAEAEQLAAAWPNDATTRATTSATTSLPDGPTESERSVRIRRVQAFFRRTVLVSYGNCCAVTGLSVPALLNASHIIPWRENDTRRADPHNGLCLNALHDRAFDRGLITFDAELRLVVSTKLKREDHPPEFHRSALLALEGTPLRAPERFRPDPAALEHHRTHIFEHDAA